MLVIKRLFVLGFLVLPVSYLLAIEPEHLPEKENKLTFYAGINPITWVSFLPNGIGTGVNLYGVISGQEFGISIYGGMYFAKSHSLELRFSTGPADLVVWDTQIQFGYLWYPFEHFLDWSGGLSTGLMLRQFFWNNRITDYTIFNLTPELLLGWRFIVRQLAFDVRAGWNFASVTWSDIPHTKVGMGWKPFPYNLNIMFGMVWVFN